MVRSEGNMSMKNPVTPPGIDPGTVRLVAQRLNHYDTPGPIREEVPGENIELIMRSLSTVAFREATKFITNTPISFR